MILNAVNHYKSNQYVEFEPSGNNKVLHIEHLMPQSWEENWMPKNVENLFELKEERRKVIHKFGNLTLVTESMNSKLSNKSWNKKIDDIFLVMHSRQ